MDSNILTKLFKEGFCVNSITIRKFFDLNCGINLLPSLLKRSTEIIQFTYELKDYFETSKDKYKLIKILAISRKFDFNSISDDDYY